jgi:hypothetical protein
VRAPATAEHALDQRLDAMMAGWGITNEEVIAGYNVPEIRKYAHALALARARGLAAEAPTFDWQGFTTAGGHVPGPPEGKLKPAGSIADWISLTPLDGESVPEWNERADAYTQRVDAFIAAVFADAFSHAAAVVADEQRLDDFKRDELPAILDALHRIREREAPRVRHGCDSCS